MEEPTDDSRAPAQVRTSGTNLVTHLQDFVERPPGARGPDSFEVELGVTVPLSVAAGVLGVHEAAVLQAVSERFRGQGGELLRWGRGLDAAVTWSRTEAM